MGRKRTLGAALPPMGLDGFEGTSDISVHAHRPNGINDDLHGSTIVGCRLYSVEKNRTMGVHQIFQNTGTKQPKLIS